METYFFDCIILYKYDLRKSYMYDYYYSASEEHILYLLNNMLHIKEQAEEWRRKKNQEKIMKDEKMHIKEPYAKDR